MASSKAKDPAPSTSFARPTVERPSGTPSAGTKKPTLFLIHGLRGSHHGFSQLADLLAEDYNIINPDIPGSGGRPELTPHTLDSYVEYFHETISALPEKPTIVAHSMGTILASHYAERYPDDTRDKIVLISPIIRSPAKSRLDKLPYYTIRTVLAPLPKSAKKGVLASRPVSYVISHFLTCDRSRQKYIDEQHYKYSGRFSSAHSLLSDIKISSTTSTIFPSKKTTLVIMGRKDRLISSKTVASKTKSSQKATYCELDDTGHLINYERPAEAAALITDFLK